MDIINKYRKTDRFLSPDNEIYIDEKYDKTPVKNNREIKKGLILKQELITKIIKYFLVILVFLFIFLLINLYKRKVFHKIGNKIYNDTKSNDSYIKKVKEYLSKFKENEIDIATVPIREFKKPEKKTNIKIPDNIDIDNIRDYSENLLDKINNFEKEEDEVESIFEFKDDIEKMNIDNEDLIREIKKRTHDLSRSKMNYQNFKENLKNHETEYNNNMNELIGCKKNLNLNKENFNKKLKEFDEVKDKLDNAQKKFNNTIETLNDQEANISKKDKEMREQLRKLFEDISEFENTLKNEDKIKLECIKRKQTIHNDEFNIKVKKENLENEKSLRDKLENEKNEIENFLEKERNNLDKILNKEKFYLNKLNIAISNKNIQELLEGMGQFQTNKMQKLTHLINIIVKKQKETFEISKEDIEDDIIQFDKSQNDKLNFKELMQNFLKLQRKVKSYDINQINSLIAKLEKGLKQVQYLKIEINNSISEYEKKNYYIKIQLDDKNNTIKLMEDEIKKYETNIFINQDFINKKQDLIAKSKEGLEKMKLEKTQKEKEYEVKLRELKSSFDHIDNEWKENNSNYQMIKNNFSNIKELVFDLNKDLNNKFKECEVIEAYLNDFKSNFNNVRKDMVGDVGNIKKLEKEVQDLMNKLIK